MARNISGLPRLLILDGHNSHCTYRFCKFAADHSIIIICLPSHTTHALQPCDVGVFGPLAASWKSTVVALSQTNTPIDKYNFLQYYSGARTRAFKESTVCSAFRKTGIWPLDRKAIDERAFAPALNTTTQAALPLPTPIPLPSLLVRLATPDEPGPIAMPTITPLADIDQNIPRRLNPQDLRYTSFKQP